MDRLRIKKNAIQCPHCEDVIESQHRHDFKFCSCGSFAVDGGKDYLRRCGEPGAYIELSEYEEVQDDRKPIAPKMQEISGPRKFEI